jgi:PPOX class probable F420-dependent enzyme
MAELSESARSKVDAPNLAFLATVMPDGSPQVTPVWIARENGHITFNTAVGRVKEKNMRRDPRVAISIADQDDPYNRVCIRGRVVEMTVGDEADRQIDELAKKYLGKDEYPWRRPTETRVKVVVEPLSVTG